MLHHLIVAIDLPWLFIKQKIYNFIACFNRPCSMFVYRVEKPKVETEEVLSVLFSLLIPVNTALLCWFGQNVLTAKEKMI